jgi:hypothetical protein
MVKGIGKKIELTETHLSSRWSAGVPEKPRIRRGKRASAALAGLDRSSGRQPGREEKNETLPDCRVVFSWEAWGPEEKGQRKEVMRKEEKRKKRKAIRSRGLACSPVSSLGPLFFGLFPLSSVLFPFPSAFVHTPRRLESLSRPPFTGVRRGLRGGGRPSRACRGGSGRSCGRGGEPSGRARCRDGR